VGAGAKYLECRQKVTDWGLDNCLFLPYQPKEVLPYSLTAGDLALVSIAPGLEGVVVPSKLYGVMAAGVAIAAVCEPHSYLQSFLSDFDCGACFQNNDAEGLANFIRQLAANPQKAKAMGLMGREHLRSNFTPQIIAQQYAEIIRYGARVKTYQDINIASRQEVARQEVTRHEAVRQEVTRQEVTRHEAVRQEVTRQEVTRHEAVGHEATRQEVTRQEVTRHEITAKTSENLTPPQK
jgi:hypothetical protein